MVIDHINIYLGSYLGLPTWIGFLGRFVAPLFVFMMVEGFHYTRSRKNIFKAFRWWSTNVCHQY